ncbi:MAG: hypothetical protein ABIV06_11690 [Thermoanaerobaculia bacterium]
MPSPRPISCLVLFSLLACPLAAADGDLDPNFWTDGKVALPGTGDVTFGGLAAHASGALAIGYTVHAGEKEAYWRSVTDSTWGAACRVIVGSVSSEIDTYVYDAAFDASGRLIVLAKKTFSFGGDQVFAVLAYEFPYCRLDLDFGTDGIVYLPQVISLLTDATRLATTSDGKILIAGGEGLYDAQKALHYYSRLVRLEPDGDFDPTLDDDGVALGGEPAGGVDLAVAPNGHIVMAAVNAGEGEVNFLVHDFSPDGTFLAETVVAFDLGGTDIDEASAIAATADGKVVIVGTVAANPIHANTYGAIAVLSWNPQGDLVPDSTFSGDGKMTLAFNSRSYSSLSDVVVQGASRILVAGTAKTQIIDNAMAIARLALDGTFDATFYPPGNGRRLVDFDIAAPENDLANRLVLQQGRIVIGGQVDIAGDVTSVGVARLENQWIFGGGFDQLEVGDWFLPLP